MNKLQKESIKLYRKRISYAKTQDYDDKPVAAKMFYAIGHHWGGGFCLYCREYEECNYCPLYQIAATNLDDNKIFIKSCCANLYTEMSRTKTWKDWIYYAEQIIDFIKENG